MDNHTLIVIWALGVLTIIEVVALFLGYDGTLLATVLAVIGGAIGYEAKARRG